jgi:hypothetical protein
MFSLPELDYLMQCVDERKSSNHIDRINKGAMLSKIAQLIQNAQQPVEAEPKAEE